MTKETDAQWESAKARMTGECTCNREHWQPHAESCPAYKPRPLLTIENIRSGAFPSDAHAVGFLLGEVDILRGNLSLAEEGLANAMQEIERLKAALRLLDNGFKYSTEVCNIARGALAQSSHEPSEQPFKITATCECGLTHSAMSNQPFKMLGIMCPCGKVTPFIRDAESSQGASRDASKANDGGPLCSDCPPVGYPTDKTRCDECPRRSTSRDASSGKGK